MAHRTILTDRQRAALFDLPGDEAAHLRFYVLSDRDIGLIRRRRRPWNRLGFALQLCAFRYPGRLIQPGETIPEAMLAFIGAQLGFTADELVFHVFGAIAHFERRLIAERTRDGIAAARAEGRKPGRKPLDPEKLQAAVTLIRSGLSPGKAARQVGLGRSTLYRELALMPEVRRQPA